MGTWADLMQLQLLFKTSEVHLKDIQQTSVEYRTSELQEQINQLEGRSSREAKQTISRLKSKLRSEQRKEGFKRLNGVFIPR